MTRYNPETTRLLATVVDALPVADAQAQPITHVRDTANRIVRGLVYVYDRLGHIDEDGAAALETLRHAVESHGCATRAEIVEGLSYVATEVAGRTLQLFVDVEQQAKPIDDTV